MPNNTNLAQELFNKTETTKLTFLGLYRRAQETVAISSYQRTLHDFEQRVKEHLQASLALKQKQKDNEQAPRNQENLAPRKVAEPKKKKEHQDSPLDLLLQLLRDYQELSKKIDDSYNKQEASVFETHGLFDSLDSDTGKLQSGLLNGSNSLKDLSWDDPTFKARHDHITKLFDSEIQRQCPTAEPSDYTTNSALIKPTKERSQLLVGALAVGSVSLDNLTASVPDLVSLAKGRAMNHLSLGKDFTSQANALLSNMDVSTDSYKSVLSMVCSLQGKAPEEEQAFRAVASYSN